ncbi:MAG TPA: PfkB family carbohydrate kinase [Streptosporangiaceae bacterium]
MITVAGEALIDLVLDHDGCVGAQPGGGPFNTARTIGRLGLAPAFLGRLSRDRFGRLLRASLDQDGVRLSVPEPVDAPTTLAVVEVDTEGAAHYGFYLAGTASEDLEFSQLAAALPDEVTALHAGSLALTMEPVAASVERLITDALRPDTLVMVDPNCRPQAISDHPAYRARLTRILRRTDIVKVSREDLAYLYPDLPAQVAAARLLDLGPHLILMTDGPRPARALLPGQQVTVEVPQVDVVDTIGAGDAFGGGFLSWWTRSELTRRDLHRIGEVREALLAAAQVAALTCTRVGAEPPWLAEVEERPGWRSRLAGDGRSAL